jgi:hypothetical protein
MTDQVFLAVGITLSESQPNAKIRFTNDMFRRIKQGVKNNLTRCDFIELPSPMTKVDALKYMLTRPEFASPADQATINDAAEDKTPRTPKTPKAVKAKPSLEAIKARTRNKATTTAEDVLEAVAG